MAVVLTSTADVLAIGTVSSNSAKCTWASPACAITSGAAAGWLLRNALTIGPNVASVVTVSVTNTGVAAISLQATAWVLDAAGSSAGSVAGATVSIAAGATYIWTLAFSSVSSAAASMRVDINLGTTAGAGWQFRVNAISSVATVTVSELISAVLDRPLNAEASDSGTARVPVITRGPAGALTSRLVYLCDDLATALTIDGIHQLQPAVVLSGDSVGALSGLSYYATAKLQLSAEKAIPGRPSKWLATVEGTVV